MTDANDMELLRDYDRHGSEAAFAALVARHIHLVYSVALRHTGMAAHAEEITQAVFVILARKAASLRPDTILEGWLHETTRLTALSFLRGERRRQFREQEAYMQSTLPAANDAALWNQLAPMLDEAVSRLGKKDRDAVMLRFFKDKNLREVAAALDVTEAAAQRRVHRAVEKLRGFFMKRGVTLTAAVLTAAISANSVQAVPLGLAATVTATAAKGAVVSGSTLTLIKGALKIMAWTKAKMAIGAVAGLILATGVSVVVVEKESLIQGKTESEWIKSIVYFGDEQQRELWHSLGPKGINMLLHAMKPPSAGLTKEEAIANRQTRAKAAWLLGALENTYNDDATNAVPDVIKLLQTEKDAAVRGLEVGYFYLPIQSMSEKNKGALLPELIRSMQSKDTSERNNALDKLQYYPDQTDKTVPLMLNALQDASPLVRVAAVRALNAVDPQNVASTNFIPVLAWCVTNPPGLTPSAPNAAVVMLGEFHREPAVAVPALIEALGSDQFWARANAAKALANFGGQAKDAVPALQKALEDSDASVRSQAATALNRINSEATAK